MRRLDKGSQIRRNKRKSFSFRVHRVARKTARIAKVYEIAIRIASGGRSLQKTRPEQTLNEALYRTFQQNVLLTCASIKCEG